MEFLFHITNYDDPALDAEAAELLRQRLEARSREVVPGMWKVTDRLNARAARGPGREKRRRYRVYGVLLIALGVFALVPGLMEPRIPSLIMPVRRSASCVREAADLLAGRRAVDWGKAAAEVRFDGSGMTVSAQEDREAVPYGDMTGIFETERLWLLVYGGEKALLLQKKDLTSGVAAEFPPFLRDKINNRTYQ